MNIIELKKRKAEISDRIRAIVPYGVLDYDMAIEYGDVCFQIKQIENPNWLRELAA